MRRIWSDYVNQAAHEDGLSTGVPAWFTSLGSGRVVHKLTHRARGGWVRAPRVRPAEEWGAIDEDVTLL
jgi:hypothetical protein